MVDKKYEKDNFVMMRVHFNCGEKVINKGMERTQKKSLAKDERTCLLNRQSQKKNRHTKNQ